MPRFSVLVPAYNAEATLRETLDSISAQTMDDWECVVVDDGSADDTAAIVSSYESGDPRFRLLRQENRGAAGAYRTAAAAATADLFVICAADDLLLPEHLATMDDLIARNPECGIFSCNGEFLDDASGDLRIAYAGGEWEHERSLSLDEVIHECFFSVGAILRRSVYELTGGHRPGVYVDDYDLWLRAMARGVIHRYTPCILAVHRVSDFQQSADSRRLWQSDIEVYRHLIAKGYVPPESIPAIEQSIRRRTEWLEGFEVAEAFERQARTLREGVERRVGSRWAEPAMKAIHAISWITRPVRRALARRRAC